MKKEDKDCKKCKHYMKFSGKDDCTLKDMTPDKLEVCGYYQEKIKITKRIAP
jgi:hypothetical protein